MSVFTLNAAKLYGWAHITFLAIYIAAFVVSLVLIKLKVKSERKIDLTVKALGWTLLALVLFNRIAISFHRETAWGLIPDSFCGFGSLALAISCIFFKRGALPYHVFVYCMLFGGVIAVFYPDFLGQEFHGEATSFMYPATISGLMHHALAFYIAVFLLVTEHFKPCFKKTYALPLAICIELTYGLFLMEVCGFETAMYIGNRVIPNTFIGWFIIYPLIVGGAYAIALIYEKVIKKKSKEKQDEIPTEQNESTSL